MAGPRPCREDRGGRRAVKQTPSPDAGMSTRKRRCRAGPRAVESAPASAPASGPGRGPGGIGPGVRGRRWGWLPWRAALPPAILAALLCLLVRGVAGQSVQAVTAAACPTDEEISPCRCSLRGDEVQIWCSHSELPAVLAALRNVARLLPTRPLDELILENNAWTSLGGASLAGPTGLRVSRLMLRDNGLETVAATWLAGLEDSLLELFLVEPMLRAFPDDSLIPFKRLEAVTLQCGEIQRLPRLAGLPRLRYALVQSSMLWELPPGHLSNLPYLEQLHIVSSPRLASLDADAVTDLPRLSAVNISDTGLTWIHPRALRRLPALAEVTLRTNKLSDAAMVGRALSDLPSLATVRVDDNQLEILPSLSFADLPALRELSLGGNRIIELQHGAFQRLPALRSLDLSRNQLRVIHPEAFLHQSAFNLDQLYLQENSLDSADVIRHVLDALPRLRFLDVSDNRIVEIGMGVLGRGHGALERLHLDRNRLHRVFRDSFNNMPALRELRLSHNMLSNNLDQPYWNLPALKGLDLSYNQFRRCDPRLLANLPSLRRLDLSGNNIAHVDPGSFLNTPALEHINLSSNALALLSPATFRVLLNLFELDVGRNRLSQIVPGLPPAVEYLRMPMNQVTVLPPPASPDMNLPALRLLDLSNNGLKRVPADAFRQMHGLQQLLLSGNALQTLETGALQGLNRLERLEMRANRLASLLPRSLQDQRFLRELDLRGNRLEALPGDVLQEAVSLQTIDLSRNQLASIEPDAMRGNRNLEVFRASHNALPSIPSALLQLPSLRVLDLSHNRVRELPPGALNSLAGLQEFRLAKNKLRELRVGAVERLPRLQILDLDSNELHNVQPRSLNSLPSLQQLNLARNRLQTLPEGAISDVPNLMQCELQENQLAQVSAGALAGAPHLLHLNMSFNQITALENAGLQHLRSLEVLDLSHNRVSRVNADTLDSMEWLVELKMDSNRICNIQGVPFNNMPRLRVLSLNNNKMTSLPETTFQRLKNNVAQLQLNGNPLSCSCDLLWLHSWLLEAEAGAKTGDGPRCADGSLVKEIRVSRAECDAAAKSAPLSARQQHVNPACDAEIVDLPTTNVIGNSQIVSTALEVRGSTMAPQQNVAPSPEESEYFYDEYVDVQVDENATAVNNASLVATPAGQTSLHTPLGAGVTAGATAAPVTATAVASHSTPAMVGPGPGTSSHYISGDTPTLYAGTKNKLGPGMTPADDPKRMPPAAATPGGLTFFGIPLKMPSLNIGGIFGHGRDADGKPVGSRSAELENGTVSSRERTYPTLPTAGTTFPVPTASVVRVSPVTGGFRPMVPVAPGPGGFSFTGPVGPGGPTGSPQLDIFRQQQQIDVSSDNRRFPSFDGRGGPAGPAGPIVVTENYNFRDGHEERIKQHHSSEENVRVRTSYQRRPGEGSSLSPGFVTVVSVPDASDNDAAPRGSAPLREFPRDSSRESMSSSRETSREQNQGSREKLASSFPTRPPGFGKGQGTVSRVEATATVTAATTLNPVTGTAATTTTDPAVEVEQAVIYSLGELAQAGHGRTPSSVDAALNDIVGSTVSTTTEEYDWTTASSFHERPGSALSALLAPGGQLPGIQETHMHSHSQSTVTRVAMSGPSGAGSGLAGLAPGPAPGPALDDPQSGPIPRSAKGPHYYYAEAPGTSSGDSPQKQISRDTHSWYYENYNRTNLQPFVGPGSEAYSRSRSSASAVSAPVWGTLFSLVLSCVAARASVSLLANI